VKDLHEKVAVVTGAASGIGRAMAGALATEGMKIVLADVEAGALSRAESEMKAGGATVLAVVTDVSRAADVEALAQRALDAYGAVHLVCNNAGVAVAKDIWEYTLADWQWVLGVNLWGVIHGIRSFVPRMLAQGGEGHIVNTASVAGLTSTPRMGPYNVSKHAVVTLSETLQRDLLLRGSALKVSVLCPGFVATRIMDSERNRPANLANAADTAALPPQEELVEQMARQLVAAGLPPEQVARRVVAAVKDERFYILPHPEFKAAIRARMEDVLEERNPDLNMPIG